LVHPGFETTQLKVPVQSLYNISLRKQGHMGTTELIFIFIFILIMLINVIARIVAARAREKKRSAASQKETTARQEVQEEPSIDLRTVKEKEQKALRAEEERIRDFSQMIERKTTPKQFAVQPELQEPAPPGQSFKAPNTDELIPQSTINREVSSLDETIKEKELSMVESSALPTLQVDVKDRLLTHIGYGEYGKSEQREYKIGSGWEKINRLPTLKRAIILSEIIGKPKGLE
jgi:Na+-transporting methylmalonyl-CoA/oxaloacetate decarboxylase gamma subunit